MKLSANIHRALIVIAILTLPGIMLLFITGGADVSAQAGPTPCIEQPVSSATATRALAPTFMPFGKTLAPTLSSVTRTPTLAGVGGTPVPCASQAPSNLAPAAKATATPTRTWTPTPLPQTLVVTKLTPDTNRQVCAVNDCTLREAIFVARSRDTITFQSGLSGVIVLSSSLGTLTINKQLTINGPDSSTGNSIAISGGDAIRVFTMSAPGSLTISNLTITHGKDTSGSGGGAIYNNDSGDLTISNSTFQNNSSTGSGGAIYHANTHLTITNSTFGSLTDSSVRNSALNGGAIAIFGAFGNNTITNSTFGYNQATSAGGAIENQVGVDIISSTFASNSSSTGGALRNLTATGYLLVARFTITNSTFYNNSASSQGSAIWAGAANPNYAYPVQPAITNSTFSDGIGSADGVIYNSTANSNATIIIFKNTIIASSSGRNCSGWGFIDGDNHNGHNLQYPGTTCADAGTPFPTGNPNLSATLAANGGSTWTLALQSPSAAIDQGDDLVCSSAPVNGVDQRSYPRPVGPACDIGAFEYLTVEQELALYGVELADDGVKHWTDPEKQGILDGVRDSAQAFNQITTNHASLPNVFERVMGVAARGNIRFMRTNATDNNCLTENNVTPRTITCRGNLDNGTGYLNKYTAVHELGHVFDNQSAQGGQQSLSDRMGPQVVLDCGRLTTTPGTPTALPARIMGQISGENDNGWTRGERGWGSGPARKPGGSQLITDFQQDPLLLTGTPTPGVNDKPTRVGEAAADMFLNWVYRKLASNPSADPCTDTYPGQWNGFHNEDWRTMTSNSAIPGTPDDTRPGSKRYQWMSTAVPDIFQQHGW